MLLRPRPSQFALLALLVLTGSVAQAQAPAAAAPPPPATGFAMASLRPALANVQTAIANLGVAHWKVPNETRAAVQQDVISMQRDLTTTLPGLMAQAEASQAALSPAFAVFRNLDALYDVLLRVTETAALAGSGADAVNLEDVRAQLEDGRAKLGTWLLQSIGAQDAQVVQLRASIAAQPAAPPPPPSKVVVDDGPPNPKPHKKKPAPAPAPQ